MFRKIKDRLKSDQTLGSSIDADAQLYQHNGALKASYNQPAQQELKSGEQYQAPPGHPSGAYAPPAGPPPGHSSSVYIPPQDPPPSHFPPQPPPSWDPPPYHDWTVIPDTSLLPPPPSIGYDDSPSANATAEDGDRALAWTNANPLWPAQSMAPSAYAAIQNGQLALLKPPTYTGDMLPQRQPGHWRCRTHTHCKDSSILSNLPLYSVYQDSPLRTQHSKSIYFELHVKDMGTSRAHARLSRGEADAGIAMGFVAPPYPTFRLPGWERASLAVHGDDGRKYVNNPWGGSDFTTAFAPGETLGIGMTFNVPAEPPRYEQAQARHGKLLDVHVFFTRNGKKEGGWDGNEELDERSRGGNKGLQGDFDLFPAVGVFGGVDFDVFFHPSQWLYKPR